MVSWHTRWMGYAIVGALRWPMMGWPPLDTRAGGWHCMFAFTRARIEWRCFFRTVLRFLCYLTLETRLMDFENQRVLITGSTRGIGYAAATAFLKQGARVAINGRRTADVERAIEALGSERLVAAAGDLATAAFTGTKLGVAILWVVVLGAFIKFVLNEGLTRWQLPMPAKVWWRPQYAGAAVSMYWSITRAFLPLAPWRRWTNQPMTA